MIPKSNPVSIILKDTFHHFGTFLPLLKQVLSDDPQLDPKVQSSEDPQGSFHHFDTFFANFEWNY
jgi:hypothetical protein